MTKFVSSIFPVRFNSDFVWRCFAISGAKDTTWLPDSNSDATFSSIRVYSIFFILTLFNLILRITCKVFNLWWKWYSSACLCSFLDRWNRSMTILLGDPVKFHATCMAICLKSHQSLTPVELAAYSRVATQVKKTVLLCSVAVDSDAPYYLSVNWWKG